jgi:hypothetical protein
VQRIVDYQFHRLLGHGLELKKRIFKLTGSIKIGGTPPACNSSLLGADTRPGVPKRSDTVTRQGLPRVRKHASSRVAVRMNSESVRNKCKK